jgi:hypothetical protein
MPLWRNFLNGRHCFNLNLKGDLKMWTTLLNVLGLKMWKWIKQIGKKFRKRKKAPTLRNIKRFKKGFPMDVILQGDHR